MKLSRIGFIALLFLAQSSMAALLNASDILAEINKSASMEQPGSKAEQLMQEMKSSKFSSDSKEYVDQWLVWFDRFWLMSNEERLQYWDANDGTGISLKLILRHLPEPSSWKYMENKIKQGIKLDDDTKKSYILSIISKITEGNIKDQIQLTEDFINALSTDEKYGSYLLENHLTTLYSHSGERELLKTHLEKLLSNTNNKSEHQTLTLPDLVTLFGEKYTNNFIERALKKENIYVTSNNKAIVNIIKTSIIDLGSKVKNPYWHFVNEISSQSITLYEAIEASNEASIKTEQRANAYYLFSLIVDGQLTKALNFTQEKDIKLEDFNKRIFSELINAGHANTVYKFFSSYINEVRSVKLIPSFTKVSVAAGKHDEIVSFLNSWRKEKSLSDSNSITLELEYLKALRSIGRHKDFLKLLARIENKYKKNSGKYSGNKSDLLTIAIDLMKAGIYDKNADWYKRGKNIAKRLNPEFLLTNEKNSSTYIDVLIEKGELEEAQELLIEKLKFQSGATNASGYQSTSVLRLIAIYEASDQCRDAIELLDDYAQWGAIDTNSLIFTKIGKPYQYAGSFLARCFMRVGRQDVAKKISESLLYYKSGYDPAYEIYLQLVDSDEAIETFRKIYELDGFEERPLIWTAQVLINQKQYGSAMEYLNRAISIDPSDGEQGMGSRMRAYQLMANIYKLKGDDKGFQEYKNVTSAIRKAELADELYSSGFLKYSIELYEDALHYFSGAYCIQSRLAVRKDMFGQPESALDHYRRAYELMPNSFGFMESHCLGCSSVFDSKTAQQVAEEVFSDLLKSDTKKPQTYYMMGYLKKLQKDYTSAWSFYSTAASMDGKYINAWREMNKIQDELILTPADYDSIVLNLVKLDPLSRHIAIGEHHVFDSKKFWTVTAEAYSIQLPKIPPMYPLTVTKKVIDISLSNANQAQKNIWEAYFNNSNHSGAHQYRSPGDYFANHQVFKAIEYLLDPDY